MNIIDMAATVPQSGSKAARNALKLATNALRLRQRLPGTSSLTLPLVALALILCVQLPGRSIASPLSVVADYDDSPSEEVELISHETESSVKENVDILALPQESLSSRRLHRRHISHHQPADNLLQWQNSCGQFDDGVNDRSPELVQHYLMTLRRIVRLEYETLKLKWSNGIDANITEWRRMHQHHYKFLPRLQDNAPLTPMNWHRSMQQFIAAFAFLSNMQHERDLRDQGAKPDTFNELHELLLSAKRVLCEVASAISGVYPRSQRCFSVYSSADMKQLLSFRTKDARHIVSLDLRFAKHHYYSYLLALRRSLRRDMLTSRLVYGCSASSSSAMSGADFDMSENAAVRGSSETGDSTF